MLIGLSGYARSGKDSVAEILVTNEGFERRAFADKLREALIALNPTLLVKTGIGGTFESWELKTAVRIYGWEKLKETAPDSRLLLQRLGTEVGRNMLGEDIWVNATLGASAALLDVVVTDCRFPNEARAIKQNGGFLVRVTRPGVGPANDHPSEVGLDSTPFDFYLDNDGDLADLVDATQDMLVALEGHRLGKVDALLELLGS